MASFSYTNLETETGLLEIEASEDALTRVGFLFDEKPQPVSSNPLLEAAKNQFKAYFNGRLQSFDLPVNWSGTDFQKEVWQQLLTIPYGKTMTYSELANRLGDPKKVRAVGAANGKNPLAIIVPCHRVIGASGQLVGYAGGLHRKKWLLRLEAELHSGQTTLF